MELDQQIFKTFIEEGMPANLANLMMAQVKHESKEFTSNVFKKNNNLNGYKYVKQPLATKGLKSPEGDYYAKYKTPLDSARELARWIKRRVNEGKFPSDLTLITTPFAYATLLKSAGYYGDSVKTYEAGIRRYYKEYTV